MTETAVRLPAEVRRPIGRAVLGSMRELALLPAIAILFVFGIVSSSAFFTTSNFSNAAQGSAAVGMVVAAETLILLTGSFDLSLQSIYGLAPMVGAWLIVGTDGHGLGTEWSPAVGILIVLALGAAVGLFNGLMVVKLRFNAFIFTLAMLILLAGIQQGIVHGQSAYNMPWSFVYLGSVYWFGFPLSAWTTIAVFLAAGLFLRFHRTGRAIYAIGGNLEAARAAGIKVDQIRIGVFSVAGVLAAIGGLMTAGQVLTVTANQGQQPGIIFTVFAAAVIGGISLDGGRGSLIGALAGVLLLSTVENLLTVSHVQPFWIQAIYGGIILAALVLSRVAGGRSQN
jgi:simple sugar transport system permease protein